MVRMSYAGGSHDEVSQGGNGIVRILKAPFKALGRLLGRGKKNEVKLERLSEKDVAKFEATPTVRVNDATSSPTIAALQPDASAQEHLERGRALLDNENLNEAISELSLAESMDPKLADAKNLLGVAYGRKGMSESARKCFEAALKLDKNNSEILNNLGYLLYANGDYSAALARLKKAARLAPDDKRILTNLALAQSRLGKFDDAYKNFVRAGGEIEGRLNLANRLQLAGRSDEALKQFETAKRQAATIHNNDAQAITVVMEIRNGLVTFASIAHPRPGMGAYEASALRIARQRRYPADKNGQESVVVKISPFPAS